jgi:hypothetical protein
MHTVRLLGTFAAILSVLIVLLGLPKQSRWPAGSRALLRFICVEAAGNVITGVMAYQNIHNERVALWIIPCLAITGMEALGQLAQSSTVLKWFRVSTALYMVSWALAMRFVEHSDEFTTVVAPAMYLLLTLASAALIVKRVKAGVPHLLRDPAILAGLGTMLASAPSAALDPVSLSLYHQNKPLVLILFSVRAALISCGYVLYILALKWTQPRRLDIEQ